MCKCVRALVFCESLELCTCVNRCNALSSRTCKGNAVGAFMSFSNCAGVPKRVNFDSVFKRSPVGLARFSTAPSDEITTYSFPGLCTSLCGSLFVSHSKPPVLPRERFARLATDVSSIALDRYCIDFVVRCQ